MVLDHAMPKKIVTVKIQHIERGEEFEHHFPSFSLPNHIYKMSSYKLGIL